MNMFDDLEILSDTSTNWTATGVTARTTAIRALLLDNPAVEEITVKTITGMTCRYRLKTPTSAPA